MKILRKIAKAQIALLVKQYTLISSYQKQIPVETFWYARITLALAITDLKIEMWRAVCR